MPEESRANARASGRFPRRRPVSVFKLACKTRLRFSKYGKVNQRTISSSENSGKSVSCARLRQGCVSSVSAQKVRCATARDPFGTRSLLQCLQPKLQGISERIQIQLHLCREAVNPMSFRASKALLFWSAVPSPLFTRSHQCTAAASARG